MHHTAKPIKPKHARQSSTEHIHTYRLSDGQQLHISMVELRGDEYWYSTCKQSADAALQIYLARIALA